MLGKELVLIGLVVKIVHVWAVTAYFGHLVATEARCEHNKVALKVIINNNIGKRLDFAKALRVNHNSKVMGLKTKTISRKLRL